MRVYLCLALAVAAVAAIPRSGEIIPGEYSLLLRGNVRAKIAHLLKGVDVSSETFTGRKLFLRLKGASEQVVERLRQHPLVAAVSENRYITLSDVDMAPTKATSGGSSFSPDKTGPNACVNQPDPGGNYNIWHLARTSSRALPPPGSDFRFDDDGNEADVYILDSGIDLQHPELVGRAFHDFTGDDLLNQGDEDENGHGTHCAGLAGGTMFGPAKGVTLYSVKVLGRFGWGTLADVNQGIAHTTVAAQGRGRTAVLSMSIGAGVPDETERTLLEDFVSYGHLAVAAAGNENANTAGSFPAGYDGIIAVGATDNQDRLATFSNWGPMNDVNAPGVNTWSAGSRHSNSCNDVADPNNCFLEWSGTSMACPIVAGVAARTRHQDNDVFAAWLHSVFGSTHDMLSFPNQPGGHGTPNRVVHLDDC